VIGISTDTLGWALFFTTLIWIGIQNQQFLRVKKWSQQTWRKPANGSDSWFDVAYQPHRALLRERRRTKQATSRLRQILDLVELIPDGIVVLTKRGVIEELNQSAAHMLQLHDRHIGLCLPAIVRNPDFVDFINTEATGYDRAPLEFASSLNPDHTLEARRFSIEGGGVIILIRDITTLNRLLTVRQNFVANVSHELRTPLAVIQGYMESISDPAEPTDLRLSLTSKLTSPLNRMQSLVDDLLLLTNLESTEPEENLAAIDLAAVTSQALKVLGEYMHADSRVVTHFDAQSWVIGNPNELQSLVVNLITNALRYSHDDAPVDVTISCKDGRVRFSVTDQGVGIAPEHLDRLTERFYRVDMADSRTRGGTGLGLAIVKHVLRRHDSKLSIETKLGEGTTFWCELSRTQQHIEPKY
jgi:two-component system phosphate regulon sensor histidine kinase PhoR